MMLHRNVQYNTQGNFIALDGRAWYITWMYEPERRRTNPNQVVYLAPAIANQYDRDRYWLFADPGQYNTGEAIGIATISDEMTKVGRRMAER